MAHTHLYPAFIWTTCKSKVICSNIQVFKKKKKQKPRVLVKRRKKTQGCIFNNGFISAALSSFCILCDCKFVTSIEILKYSFTCFVYSTKDQAQHQYVLPQSLLKINSVYTHDRLLKITASMQIKHYSKLI